MAVATTSRALRLPATPSSVRRAREVVSDALRELGEGGRVTDDVQLCVSEAVTNVVRHAYGGRPRGEVELVLESGPDELSVVVGDTGGGIGSPSRRAKRGGYGLKIIERLASRFSVVSSPGAGTEVRMVFRLGGRPRRASA